MLFQSPPFWCLMTSRRQKGTRATLTPRRSLIIIINVVPCTMRWRGTEGGGGIIFLVAVLGDPLVFWGNVVLGALGSSQSLSLQHFLLTSTCLLGIDMSLVQAF